jgi:hypothetical protein
MDVQGDEHTTYLRTESCPRRGLYRDKTNAFVVAKDIMARESTA